MKKSPEDFSSKEAIPKILRDPYEQDEQGSTRLSLDPKIFDAFPQTISWRGAQLQKKDELHVTLMHPKSLPELADVPNEKLASFLASFVEKTPIELTSFLDDFRCAKEGENQTIVVQCTVSNLSELFTRFNQEFSAALPVQAAHVTLYTLQKNRGIYINDTETMEGLDRVHLPELEAAFSKLLNVGA